MAWTTPEDVRQRLLGQWRRGRILSARLDGNQLFPLRLPLRRPDARAMAAQFDDVREWIRALDEGCRARRGFGYEIEWSERNHRELGRNRVPNGLIVPTEADALRLIGKTSDAERFQNYVDATLTSFPVLRAWLIKHPLTVVNEAEDWPRVIAVLQWFIKHPRASVYLRQIDAPGVDTKFIETRKRLLTDLLDQVLPPGAIELQFKGTADFERRYGLRCKPRLIRFRILDSRHYIGGFSDLSVPVEELASFSPSFKRVFVTENESNGLAFPDVEDSIVIFGLGYGLERLAELKWVTTKAIYYWGDIDTHGFAMLDRIRTAWPHVRSVLMDRETLTQHKRFWEREPEPYRGRLQRLDEEEQILFDDLAQDHFGESVRLEQERVSFSRVVAIVTSVVSGDNEGNSSAVK